MTINFENDNDVIVYALEKIISYARDNQYIFLAQSIWWISLIIGLQSGLVIHINNIRERSNHSTNQQGKEVSATPRDIQGDSRSQNKTKQSCIAESSSDIEGYDRQEKILQDCETFIKKSQPQQRIAALKSASKTTSRRINPTKKTKKSFRVEKGKSYKEMEGIKSTEIERRKTDGECLRCTWPSDRRGAHRVKDCRRPIRLEEGTASYPKVKQYSKQQLVPEELDCSIQDSENDSE